MKKFLFLFFLLPLIEGFSQSNCNNLDFEDDNWNGWQGARGCHPSIGIFPGNGSCKSFLNTTTCCPDTTIHPAVHTIKTVGSFDPCGEFPVVSSIGGTYSALLGDDRNGSYAQRLWNTFIVNDSNSLLAYQYAVVLEEPNHDSLFQPFFEAMLFDENGDTIPYTRYYVADESAEGFIYVVKDSVPPSCDAYGDIVYKTWTTRLVDLSSYKGQSVTLRFTSADCGLQQHIGYAYIDVLCGKYNKVNTVNICTGNIAFLEGPANMDTYSWTGPNNFTSNDSSVQVSDAGVYYLTVDGGLVLEYQVVMNGDLTIDFSIDSTCLGVPTDFTDLSHTTQGNIISWEWDFGDGNISNASSPSHTFSTEGTYNIELKATTDQGCVDSVSKTIGVYPVPQAGFFADTVCEGDVVNYSDVSTGLIISWDWSFGDGSTSTSQNPDHTYTSWGNYTVDLIVTDQNGCSDTASHLNYVYPTPYAGFSAFNLIVGDTGSFIDASTGAGGSSITSWFWDFGDGNTSVSQNPSHVYNNEGIYTVCLIVSTADGCVDTLCNNVTILPNSINQFFKENYSLSIFPNPFEKDIHIQYQLKETATVRIELLNALGQIIQTPLKQEQAPGRYKRLISVTEHQNPEGLYFIKLIIDERLYIQRIVELR